MRIYDYMCVMSTIPAINPGMGLASQQTKSKTTLNSGMASGAGFGKLAHKSHRANVSPFKADKHILSMEMQRMGKDDLRNNFSSIVSNLPQINKKAIRIQPTNQGHVSKKTKRKASIPNVTASTRMTQSVGPSILNTDNSIIEQSPVANKTGSVSVSKGKTNPYPKYFYAPKDNLFDAKRASRYDKGHQPTSFHLTQPDTNFAKFIFSNQEMKIRQGDSQSMNNAYQDDGPFNKSHMMPGKSPRS